MSRDRVMHLTARRMPHPGRRPFGLAAVGILAAAAALGVAVGRAADPTSASPGNVRFVEVADSDFDPYTENPSAAQQAWMRAHYWRMLAYPPYFDSRLSWFPSAWAYEDLLAIYTDSALVQTHPEWILRDASGNPVYLRFGCSGGTCPQYAADVGNPAFRSAWITQVSTTLANGYPGLFIDDVDLTLAVMSDGLGQPIVPQDPRTGLPMTESDWRRYVADFTVAIRAAFAQTEIVHNPLWFLGHDDPDIQRALLSADVIDVERGVNDDGLRGGTGTFGLETLLAHVDWLHAQGRAVVLDASATTDAGREYGLAGYYLVSSGTDALGNDAGSTPDDWWPGYDTFLGDALGPHGPWSGVLRRDFQYGVVLLNEPDAPPATLDLGRPYLDLAGNLVGSVTLGPAAAAVLRDPAVATTTTSSTTSTTSSTAPGSGVCPSPIIVPAGGGTFDGVTSGTSAQEGSCGGGSAPERVFQWTPSASGIATIQTCSATATGYDTVLWVRSGSCGGPEVGCNDDTRGCGITSDASNPHLGSRVTLTVTAGTTYVVAVDGYATASGPFRLTVVPPAPGATTTTTSSTSPPTTAITSSSTTTSTTTTTSTSTTLSTSTTTSSTRATTTVPTTSTTSSTTAPANGSCGAPVLVPAGGGAFDGTTTGASALTGSCGGGSAPERVFQWTPSASGVATIQTCSATLTTYDTLLYVRSGACGGSQLACNDDTTGCGTTTDPSNPHRGSRVTPTVTAGTTYFIVVDGYGTASGGFHLTVTPPAAGTTSSTTTSTSSTTSTTVPGSGTCGAPVVIPPSGGTFDGTTSGSSAQGGTCGGSGAPERVFQWTPATTGVATIQTCSTTLTTYDTLLYVRSGSCGGSQVACNDDTTGCGTTTDPGNPHRGSRVTPTVTAGTTYWIVVDGYATAQGAFHLTVTPP